MIMVDECILIKTNLGGLENLLGFQEFWGLSWISGKFNKFFVFNHNLQLDLTKFD